MDAATNAKILRKEQLMALPSVSCSLSALPQARCLEQVSLHPSSMSAQLAAESEAKVRFAPHLTFPARWCLPFPTAPQGALKIGHSLPPVIDRDAPTEPSVFSFSPADDEGVWPQFHIARRVQ